MSTTPAPGSGSAAAPPAASQREAQKARTRRALLDAALDLLEHQSLSSLGLREITRAVGVSPAAFYRHFRDVADLGVALVDEALDGLRIVIRAGLAERSTDEERIDHAVEAIADHVRAHPGHVRFLVRERHGGVAPVRRAIGAQLDRFAEEVAHVLAQDAESEGWSPEDLRMLAEIYVDHMVMTASSFLQAAQGEGPEEAAVARTARRQLRLVSLGRRHWTTAGERDG
ncbi:MULTISPECIES: TetR family transcriptional regulator [Streptomyces]|uniref:Transcriptional regulator n=1 Tax=Streptomyces cacaoi TaxID=1898 RepID=A0A4Y3R0R1_STRCI|nr:MULTISPECIES: TetR family transcriptional regulator [Streptomyces]NNG86307.1 TetR family transcriptional regulator [Streptomyces cacaoi]GEB51141.1 transcriptional regulator [Streptomyces cacaoi]